MHRQHFATSDPTLGIDALIAVLLFCLFWQAQRHVQAHGPAELSACVYAELRDWQHIAYVVPL